MKLSILARLSAVLLAAFAFAAPSFAQQTLYNATASGHFGSAPKPNGGKPPVLSTCGTSPAIAAGSNDQTGRFVVGSALTTCTLTFDVAYSRAPVCLVSAEVPTQPTYTVSATAITFSVVIASTPYHYSCRGI